MKKLLLLTILSCTSFVSFSGPDTWVVKTSMPGVLTCSGAAIVDGVIYVMGGYNTTSESNACYAYDISTNTWSTKTSMPTSRGELAVAEVGGKIYAIGGFKNISGATAVVEEYDPSTDTWTTKASMPTARSQFSVAVIGSKIYAVGGWIGSYTTLEVYDPASDTWTTKTPMSFGRLQLNGGIGMGGLFYFMGGKNYDNDVVYDSVSVYTPSTDSWSNTTNMPVARYAGSISAYKGRIYYMGGASAGGPLLPTHDNNNYFDVSTHTWNTALSMLRERSNAVAVGTSNGIFLMGGVDSIGHPINWVHEFLPSDTMMYAWNKIEPNLSGNHSLVPGNTTGLTINTIETGAISIYPNPSNGTFRLRLDESQTETAVVDILDMTGKKVYTTTITTSRDEMIHTDLVTGVYMISITAASGKYSSRLVIK